MFLYFEKAWFSKYPSLEKSELTFKISIAKGKMMSKILGLICLDNQS